MATKRSISTKLFDSPDFFELPDDSTRLIFIGLILDADDEGRGSAHTRLLARKLDKRAEEIEAAFSALESHSMVRCYVVEGRRYYVLCHWHKYQVLSRPTPSSYPPPPDEPLPVVTQSTQGNPGIPTNPQDSPGDSVLEEEGKRREEELEEKRTEAEGEGSTSPQPTDSSNVDVSLSQNSFEEIKRVAKLLKLPINDDLRVIVQEFRRTPTLSLVGEALEARAWIDNPQKNRNSQPMTLAFFRRWLKRARGDYAAPEQSGQPIRSSAGSFRKAEQTALPKPETHLQEVDPYAAVISQRIAEVQAQYAQKVAV